jgi:hypothetical protein
MKRVLKQHNLNRKQITSRTLLKASATESVSTCVMQATVRLSLSLAFKRTSVFVFFIITGYSNLQESKTDGRPDAKDSSRALAAWTIAIDGLEDA